MLKKFLGDKYTRANNIAKSVRSLQRVPEKERPRIVKKAVLNVYVIGSIIILISLWLYFFGNEIMAIPIGNILKAKRSGQGVQTSICIFLYQFSFQ